MSDSASIPARKREILVVSHYYPAQGGGIERVAAKLIEDVAKRGNFHFIWAASADGPLPTIASQSILPMKSRDLPIGGIPWPVWGIGSLKQLRNAVAHADIVWLHDAFYMGTIAAYRMARKMGKPVVVTQHIGPIPYRNPFQRGLMALADRFIARPILAGARQTAFISDSVAAHYYRRVGFTAPVQIIPNGVDGDIFRPVSTEQRKTLRLHFALRDEQPVLLFAGRFVEKKGLAALRLMAQRMPAFRFWFAGSGPLDPEKWYLPNVHVFRDREGAQLAELYQAADLLVIPSYGEGFPLVIQEAMACGLPVLCSPETAAGSRPAAPYLRTADVFPRDPARTAAVWKKTIEAKRKFLPRTEADMEIANAARALWPWPQIADHYDGIFRALVRKY